MDAVSTNLPLQLTSFIGREREIAEVKRLLGTTRLLTLTGAGGSGKTRLALQGATDLVGEYADGAWFVDLAPLADPALVPQAVASALGVSERPGRALADALTDFLRAKHIFLVLDNCEHLRDACARIAQDLLTTCPDLQILATSREDLDSPGEVTWLVPPLSLPEPDQMVPVEKLIQSEAIRLFVARAQAAQSTPPFALTDQNAALIAQICRRLDGMPLAIELAAARVKVLTVAQIAARLDNAFQLLTRGSAALPRQQTLRATITWSHDLLSEQERALFRRLAVFAGGFTLEQIESVCAGEMIDAGQVLDLLSELIDKSLVVVVERQATQARYHLLETIRLYGLEKLQQSGEVEVIRNRHLDFFMAFAEQAEPKLRGPEQFEWLDRLDMEHDNLRAALEWSLGEGRVEKGLRLVAGLMWFWVMRADWSEGQERAESLLIRSEAAPRTLTRANALFVAAEMADSQGDVKSNCQHLEELIAIAREHGAEGERLLALGLGRYGGYIYQNDPVASESMLETGLAIARALGDEWVLALSLYVRGSLFIGRRDHRAARSVLEESLTRFKSLGDKRMAADVSLQISRVNFREGEYARARQGIEQGLPFFRQSKDRNLVWRSVNSLGLIAHAEGRYGLAKRYYEEALELARELGGNWEITITSCNLAYVAVHDGELNSARLLLDQSLASAHELDNRQVVAFVLIGFASIAAAERQARRAVQLFAIVHTLLEGRDKRYVNSVDEAEYKQNLAIAREQLDEATFNAAWTEGKAMTLDQAIEYALAEQVAVPPPTVTPPHDPNALTPREVEVLRWVAAGLSNAQVAEKLVISPRTVNTHLNSIYSKLGVNSRSAVTRYALDHKLV